MNGSAGRQPLPWSRRPEGDVEEQVGGVVSMPKALRHTFAVLYGRTEGFPRIFRAHIRPCSRYDVDRYVFVEARNHKGARSKVAVALAIVEESRLGDVELRIANVRSVEECVAQGVSDDIDLRLFETGFHNGGVITFVQEPVFLLAVSSRLIQKWACFPKVLSL